MAERKAKGEFDYLLGDVTEADVSDGERVPPEPVSPEGSDYPPYDDEVGLDGSFNAFDASTWYFEPAPSPWYRTKLALIALLATSTAAVALVVSGVLLVVRGPSTAVDETPTTAVAPTTVASSEAATSPEPPPPPPPETSAAPIAPVQTYDPQTPRRTKAPEIGVTRTPVTRSPISVAPQRPSGRG